jgi:hypothetical protein
MIHVFWTGLFWPRDSESIGGQGILSRWAMQSKACSAFSQVYSILFRCIYTYNEQEHVERINDIHARIGQLINFGKEMR